MDNLNKICSKISYSPLLWLEVVCSMLSSKVKLKKSGMVMHACNPGTWEGAAGESLWVQDQLCFRKWAECQTELHSGTLSPKTKKKQKGKKGKIQNITTNNKICKDIKWNKTYTYIHINIHILVIVIDLNINPHIKFIVHEEKST